jgi:hypothetical protein
MPATAWRRREMSTFPPTFTQILSSTAPQAFFGLPFARMTKIGSVTRDGPVSRFVSVSLLREAQGNYAGVLNLTLFFGSAVYVLPSYF